MNLQNPPVVCAVAEVSRKEVNSFSSKFTFCCITHLDFEPGKSAVVLFESMRFFYSTVIFFWVSMKFLVRSSLWKKAWILLEVGAVEVTVNMFTGRNQHRSVKLQKWNFGSQGCMWFLSIHWCSTRASNLAVNNIHMGLCCTCAFLTSRPLASWGEAGWWVFLLLLLKNTATNRNKKSRIHRVHSFADWMMRFWVCSSSPMTGLYPGSYWRRQWVELTLPLCWAFWQSVAQFS